MDIVKEEIDVEDGFIKVSNTPWFQEYDFTNDFNKKLRIILERCDVNFLPKYIKKEKFTCMVDHCNHLVVNPMLEKFFFHDTFPISKCPSTHNKKYLKRISMRENIQNMHQNSKKMVVHFAIKKNAQKTLKKKFAATLRPVNHYF